MNADKMRKAVEALAVLNEGETHAAAKFLCVEAWKCMPTEARSDFVARIDFDLPHDLDLRPISLKNLLGYWDKVMIAGLGKSELKFAQMVNKRKRWPNWKPSADDERKIKILLEKYAYTGGAE